MTKWHTGTNKNIQDKHIWKRLASYKEMLINILFSVKMEQNENTASTVLEFSFGEEGKPSSNQSTQSSFDFFQTAD